MTQHHPHESHHPVDGLLAHSVVDPADLLAEARLMRHRRAVQRAGAATLAFIVFALLAVAAAQVGFSDTRGATGGTAVAVRAEALGVMVIRPRAALQRVADAAPVAGASTRETRSAATFTIDGIVRAERLSSEANLAASTRTAAASASAEHIDLFDGRVELTGVGMHAEAASSDGRARGTATMSAAARLLVDGVPVSITPNRQVPLSGVGTVIVNEQAVLANAPAGDAQTGPRYRTVGAIVHVRLTQQTAGLPAGSEIVIGRVDAGVREGKVREAAQPASGVDPAPLPPPTPLPAGDAPSSIGPSLQAGKPAPGQGALPRRAATVRGDEATGASGAGGSLQGYLFPVLGRHNYSNDYGAPRAIGPHEGNDIFAEEGTPIVAVADGVLDRVGWNTIGGYRFWLFDQYGNAFYHAHLSAYAPLAQDGAHVKRGDVIGFVGHTGNAASTPPHLHFEIHPGNGEATNPFPYLNAWQQGIVVAAGLSDAGGIGGAPAAKAPLSLLGFSDIAPNSGLGDSVLDSVPATNARPIDDENAPVDTSDSLTQAIEGPGTTPGR